jgi:hypothetical protein
MNIIGAISVLFGSINGYRKSVGDPIDKVILTSYMCVTTQLLYIRGVAHNPAAVLPILLLAPIVNGLYFCTGHHIGKTLDFKRGKPLE